MKIIYFVANGRTSGDDMLKIRELRGEGHKVIIANGSMKYGFEDRCDAVYLACKTDHVEKWATSAGIEVMKPTADAAAETADTTNETKPAAKRGRKPKSEPTDEEKKLAEAMLGGDE